MVLLALHTVKTQNQNRKIKREAIIQDIVNREKETDNTKRIKEDDMYESLQKCVDCFIEKRKQDEDTTKAFRISDMGKCMRYRYFKRQGLEPLALEERIKRVFYVGDLFHEFCGNVLKNQGVLITSEVVVDTGSEDLRGRADAIVENTEGMVLLDFKTVHSRKFHKLEQQGVDQHYKKQVLTYFKYLRPVYPKLYQARIVYISKDDLCIREYGFNLTKEEEDAIDTELKELRGYWERQELPPMLYPMKESWLCKYCQYVEHCKKAG